MPSLMLLRHAKSDWSSDYASDRSRPLNPRGIRSAKAIGEFVAINRLVPDLVLVSPAVRTLTTAGVAAEAGDWNTELRTVPPLYGASVAEVLASVRDVPNQVERLLVVGHEPTMSGTLEMMTGTRLRVVTATLISMSLGNQPWEQVAPGCARLELYIRPRLLVH